MLGRPADSAMRPGGTMKGAWAWSLIVIGGRAARFRRWREL